MSLVVDACGYGGYGACGYRHYRNTRNMSILPLDDTSGRRLGICCTAIHVVSILPLDDTSGRRLGICCTAIQVTCLLYILPIDGSSSKRLKLCCAARSIGLKYALLSIWWIAVVGFWADRMKVKKKKTEHWCRLRWRWISVWALVKFVFRPRNNKENSALRARRKLI